MTSRLIHKDKIITGDNEFVELVIWEVDPSVRASQHNYKYRLAYIVNGVCTIRYDNEAGKGDHKHIGDTEVKTTFTAIAALVNDFWTDVEKFGE